ncbi:MAG: GNAT family N-acetyltransferase [Planctomycetota bacterium]
MPIQTRPATLDDAGYVTNIHTACHGTPMDKARAWAERVIRRSIDEADDWLFLVAENDGARIGFARAGRFVPPEDAPKNCTPAGWYLLGVIVEEAWRRQGAGRVLTADRLKWIAARADEAWFFLDADNETSIALHTEFGFEEITRDFWFPGSNFDRAGGVLLRANV